MVIQRIAQRYQRQAKGGGLGCQQRQPRLGGAVPISPGTGPEPARDKLAELLQFGMIGSVRVNRRHHHKNGAGWQA